MNSQAKAVIPALIGIITLLLAGATGIDLPRVRQATVIAETRAVTLEDYSHQALGSAFRADADNAVRDMSAGIAADLALDLKHQPSVVIAQNKAVDRERG
ncbi:MAG: hypothetical protein ACR2QG_12520 [Gammaproteobacteria bacterium]